MQGLRKPGMHQRHVRAVQLQLSVLPAAAVLQRYVRSPAKLTRYEHVDEYVDEHEHEHDYEHVHVHAKGYVNEYDHVHVHAKGYVSFP